MVSFWNACQALWPDRRGGVAVMLALSLVPLTLAGLGAVDITRLTSAKSRLQDALDAAALTAARDSVADPTNLQTLGKAAFDQNLQDTKIIVASGPTFFLNDKRVVIADASAKVSDTFLIALMGGSDPTVSAHSEVNSSGANIEVSLVLDVTGSMKGGRLDQLKTAANGLVDLIVQDHQTPFYSKMALIPYSAAVNVAPYSAAVRGDISAGTCGTVGCNYLSFTAANGNATTFQVTNCVTERVIPNFAFTDDPVSTYYSGDPTRRAVVGRHYVKPGTTTQCPSRAVAPLSSDKPTLKTAISELEADGSTAGQVGLAWGWYLVSPTFMSAWTDTQSKPAAYGTDKLLKAVIFMSDGEFNTAYAKGVVSSDSTSGSGSNGDHINQPAENGLPFVQALKLCDAIKAKKIVIYTVLFQETAQDAVNFMRACATDNAKVYLPTSGVQLKDAFSSIGADITKLRLSR